MSDSKKGFFSDKNGRSMGRLISFLLVIDGIILGGFIVFLDKPQFIYMVLSIIAMSVGGKVGVVVASKLFGFFKGKKNGQDNPAN
ncbi:hypothetical protein KAH94_05055 [bacterium]|nr:hypothetical protein [bacterium]